MRGARLLALLLPCLLAGLLGGRGAAAKPEPGAGGKPSPPARDVEVPVGLPIQLDGSVIPAEWEGAAQAPLGAQGGVIKIAQHRGTLMLGITAREAWRPGSRLWLMFVADDDAAGLYQDGAVRLDFEPLDHNRAHLMVMKQQGPVEVVQPGQAVARALLGPDAFGVEVAVRLGLLGVTAETPRTVRCAVLWARPQPAGSVTWPANLVLEAPAGQPPPDLASSRSWARLGGWQEPGGSGFLPPAEWQALVDEDAELERRGRDAYGFGYRVEEEKQTRKIDREQVPLLEGNLRWIAAREPLTGDDLRLLARGYRFLNRKIEALAVLASLDADPAWRGRDLLIYDRALTLESAERYAEAAEAWDVLAGRGAEATRARYARMADRAREREGLVQEERAAREADEARGDLPCVLLRTNRGNVFVLLHADDVPNAVRNFLSLVTRREKERGFYDGTLFHRVIGDFMAQGGDPASRDEGCEAGGRGDGPSTVTTEIDPRHGYWRGAVCFARGIAQVNGCQFFILVSPRPELAEEGYTVFGHVVAGMDVVDRLEMCDELIEARLLEAPVRPEPPPKEEAGEEER